jgi:hypothetical protein
VDFTDRVPPYGFRPRMASRPVARTAIPNNLSI